MGTREARVRQLEKRPGSTWFHGRPAYADVGGEHAVVEIEVQLLAVAAPARESAAVNRHLPLARAVGKWLDVDLTPTRLRREVRQPFAVRRHLAEGFGIGPLQQRK